MSTRRREQRLDADVVIIGGGVVGAALGAGLARVADLKVQIVERHPARALTDGYDARTLALTPASQRLLEVTGVWPELDQGRIGHFRRMEVWDPGGGRIVFDSAEIGAPGLGVIVENRVLLAALSAAIGRDARIRVRTEVSAQSLQLMEDVARIELDDGTVLNTRLVVGADGSGSRVRELAGIEFRAAPYDQSALVAVVRMERSHAETARQVFMPSGPLAFLPLAEPDLCAVVWSTTPAHAAALAAQPVETFAASLDAASDRILGAMTWCGPRECHPLGHGRARRYIGTRLALIGDAAHLVHPLAGQGANLGLMDAAALIDCVTDAIAADRDPGSARVLRRYERWRVGENLLMQSALDGLRTLFAADSRSLAWLRNTGLDLVDAAVPLKRLIMRRASGYSGDVPPLARVRPYGQA